jgi:hypothetical protein
LVNIGFHTAPQAFKTQVFEVFVDKKMTATWITFSRGTKNKKSHFSWGIRNKKSHFYWGIVLALESRIVPALDIPATLYYHSPTLIWNDFEARSISMEKLMSSLSDSPLGASIPLPLMAM